MPLQEHSIENGDHEVNPSPRQVDTSSPIIEENFSRRYKGLVQIYNNTNQVEIDLE